MSDNGSARRRLLKSIVAGGGAISATSQLPASWSRSVIESVVLPAHAQTTEAPLTPQQRTEILNPGDTWPAPENLVGCVQINAFGAAGTAGSDGDDGNPGGAAGNGGLAGFCLDMAPGSSLLIVANAGGAGATSTSGGGDGGAGSGGDSGANGGQPGAGAGGVFPGGAGQGPATNPDGTAGTNGAGGGGSGGNNNSGGAGGAAAAGVFSGASFGTSSNTGPGFVEVVYTVLA